MGHEQFVKRILVGLDGSAGSAKALEWAIGLARAAGAEIVAVHAYEVPYPVIAPPVGLGLAVGAQEIDLERSFREAVEQAFTTDWTAPLEHAGVRSRRFLEEGRPGDVLVEVAEREGADLLVTGQRGRSIAALLAGGVSQHLVHRSTIPVTVVPAAADRAEGDEASASARPSPS